MNLKLESERLLLRVLFEDQAGLTTQFYNRNWLYLSAWEPNIDIRFTSQETQEMILRYEFEQLKQGHFIRYWYSRKDAPEKLLGSVCFQRITGAPFHSCEIGYKQDEASSGRGYATEAAMTAMTHLFRDCSVHRIEALVEQSNPSSIRMAERLGFEREGIARQAVFLRNSWQDCYRYACINTMELQ